MLDRRVIARMRLAMLGAIVSPGYVALAPAIAQARVGSGATPTDRGPDGRARDGRGAQPEHPAAGCRRTPSATTATRSRIRPAAPASRSFPRAGSSARSPSARRRAPTPSSSSCRPPARAKEATCAGTTFAIRLIDPVFGEYRFTPQRAGTNVTRSASRRRPERTSRVAGRARCAGSASRSQPGATVTCTLDGPGDTTWTGLPLFMRAPVPYPVTGRRRCPIRSRSAP